MELRAATLTATAAYRLLVRIVVADPVAWITTIQLGELVKAAAFNCYSELSRIVDFQIPNGLFQGTDSQQKTPAARPNCRAQVCPLMDADPSARRTQPDNDIDAPRAALVGALILSEVQVPIRV